MPVVSQAQDRFMHATAEGKTDVSPKVGKDFVNASQGMKVGKLPQHVHPKKAAFMAKRAGAHGSIRKAAKEFGTSKSTMHRTMRQGFTKMGPA